MLIVLKCILYEIPNIGSDSGNPFVRHAKRVQSYLKQRNKNTLFTRIGNDSLTYTTANDHAYPLWRRQLKESVLADSYA